MGLRSSARAALEVVENGFDRAFGPAWNPLYYLGSLGWYFFWIVCVSGIYLYVFFDTGILQAYQSLEYLTNDQWYAGGLMRSLHRYASDALVVVVMLHLVREFILDRYRGARWFAWFTGVPLLWFMYACGITGYWLVWDKLAQYVAVVTTEWLDALSIFGEPIARNFLNQAALSGRFFTLMVYIHIAVPLVMLFAMWIHIQRHAQSKVNPPRGLAIGTLLAMIVLSFAYPAVSQGPANLDTVPAMVGLDWFYLPLYPLLDRYPGGAVWASLAGITLLLSLMPWLPPGKRNPAAVVNLDNCNGCTRCFEDCPYSAVTMQPRTDRLPYEQEAVVKDDLCTACGICVGACPTSTPFRRATELVPGIDLPDFGMAGLRDDILAAAAGLSGDARVIVFGCEAGKNLRSLQGEGVAVVNLRCVAMLPPAFIDFVLARRHADGVFLTGCRDGDCNYRLGLQWTEARLAGERDPRLRKRVPRERIARMWAGPSRTRQLRREVQAFRERLAQLSQGGGRKQVAAEAVDEVPAGG